MDFGATHEMSMLLGDRTAPERQSASSWHDAGQRLALASADNFRRRLGPDRSQVALEWKGNVGARRTPTIRAATGRVIVPSACTSDPLAAIASAWPQHPSTCRRG